MDKQRERECLDAVFGACKLTVSEGEEPDFVCRSGDDVQFGVEVTEFFQTESDARLARIPGYGAELISGADYRHKDDREGIPVADIVYHRHETGEQIKMKAIPRDVPHHHISVPILVDRIATKNRKYSRYAEHVSPVDLILDDVNRTLRFESVRNLLAPILNDRNLPTVMHSGFREIYVLSANRSSGKTVVPLRANVFASEIAMFTSVFHEWRKTTSEQTHTVADYLTSLASHLSEHLPGVRYDIVDDLPRFIFASVAWTFTLQQKVNVVDISATNLSDAKLLTPDVEGDAMPRELRKMLQLTREREFGSYELCFPAHEE